MLKETVKARALNDSGDIREMTGKSMSDAGWKGTRVSALAVVKKETHVSVKQNKTTKKKL